MTNTTTVSLRMDKDLKEQADTIFGEMGMTLSTAVNIFVKQTMLQGKLPFDIYVDAFYSKENQAKLKKSIKELKEGKVITKTLKELEEYEK